MKCHILCSGQIPLKMSNTKKADRHLCAFLVAVKQVTHRGLSHFPFRHYHYSAATAPAADAGTVKSLLRSGFHHHANNCIGMLIAQAYS